METCRVIEGRLSSGEIRGTIVTAATLEGEISTSVEIGGTLTPVCSIQGALQAAIALEGELTVPSVIDAQPYQGEYHITPDQDSHILNTNGKYLSRNVVIDPIPGNYGLITWNGVTLMIS